MTLEPGTAARPGRRILFAVLCLALAAALAVLVVRTLAARDTEKPAGGGHGTAAERAAIRQVTEKFAASVSSFGPKDLGADKQLTPYFDRVAPLLSTRFRAGFKESLEIPRQLVTQYQLTRSARVDATGVVAVDGSHATSLVAVEVEEKYGTAEAVPALVRWKVDLVKVGGAWKVDDRTPLDEEPQQ